MFSFSSHLVFIPFNNQMHCPLSSNSYSFLSHNHINNTPSPTPDLSAGTPWKATTNLHNLQATKHKKNRKEVKKKNATSSNVHDCEPSLFLAFFASHIHCNKSSIILEVEFFCWKIEILLRKNKSLVKNKKDLPKGKSLVIMKYRFC